MRRSYAVRNIIALVASGSVQISIINVIIVTSMVVVYQSRQHSNAHSLDASQTSQFVYER